MTVRRKLENGNGTTSEVIGLVFDEKGKLYTWYPTFEELFLTLILDDLENQTDPHLKSIREIQKHLHADIDVHSIANINDVDYDIVRRCFHSDIPIQVVANYSLMKHIMIVEEKKYPENPGSVRTLNAYGDLFNLYIKDKNEVIKWRESTFYRTLGLNNISSIELLKERRVHKGAALFASGFFLCTL